MMSPQKQELLKRIEALIGRAQEASFVVPDDTGMFAIEDEMIGDVRQLIEKTLDLMRDVMNVYDEGDRSEVRLEDESEEDGFLREIGAAISSELAAQEVSNLAFASRTQLLENYDALKGALGNGYIWVVASHADTGLRRVGKGLISLETAIREYENLEPVNRHWGDIDDALEIRRLYGQLRRAILRQGRPEDLESLKQRLRSAANRIAILRNLEIYPFLRIYDRIPLRRLQNRIRAWQERDDDEGDKRQDGLHLWSDLTSFAELLVQINDREDLREHDRKTAKRLHRLLFDNPEPPAKLHMAHIQDLERLLGRDDDLDQIVLDPSRHRLELIRGPIERMLEQLNRPYEPHDETLPPTLGSPS